MPAATDPAAVPAADPPTDATAGIPLPHTDRQTVPADTLPIPADPDSPRDNEESQNRALIPYRPQPSTLTTGDAEEQFHIADVGPALSPKHRADLLDSGLNEHTIAAAGIYTESDPDAVAALLGSETPDPSLGPVMVFPYRTADGSPPDFHRVKPDRPRTGASNRPVKYEGPRGRGNRLYVPPDARGAVETVGMPLLITEGEKKALKATQEGFACVGLSGVWNFKNRDSEELIDDLRAIDWLGRTVIIAYDADASTNPTVRQARARLADLLQAAGARVLVAELPALPRKPKAGLDDFIVAEGVERFREVLEAAGPPESVERAARQPAKSLDPNELAERILDRSAVDGTPTVVHHSGSFMRWNGRVYEPLDRDEATDFVAGEVTRHAEFVKAEHVSNVQLHLRRRARVRKDLRPGEWLADPPDGWPGGEAMAFPNGLVSLAPLEAGRPVLLPHTPRLFLKHTSAVPFDPRAPRPTRLIQFLEEVLPGREDEKRLLRQWVGYHLLPGVALQKALLMKGPPRCGKGTFLRIIREVVGAEAVAATPLQDLGGRFGLQAVLDKSALHVGDVRLGKGKDRSSVVQTLLSMVGQDVMTADVKFRAPVTGPLPVKVTIASNELLELPDDSGALAARFLPVEFTESFVGREDANLAADLAAELPGILLWAVGGLLDLRASGRFHEPRRTVELRKEMFALGSPVAAFVDECCVIDPGFEIPAEVLRGRYTEWSKARGLPPADAGLFGKRLMSACPKVRSGQSRKHAAGRGDRVSVYRGIALTAA